VVGGHHATIIPEDFNSDDLGAGICILLANDGLILGSFFDPNGLPGYVYLIDPGNPIPVHLDSLFTINPEE
jgi:hypothetical protein